MKIIPETLRAH